MKNLDVNSTRLLLLTKHHSDNSYLVYELMDTTIALSITNQTEHCYNLIEISKFRKFAYNLRWIDDFADGKSSLSLFIDNVLFYIVSFDNFYERGLNNIIDAQIIIIDEYCYEDFFDLYSTRNS
jgi:hypothetical protein